MPVGRIHLGESLALGQRKCQGYLGWHVEETEHGGKAFIYPTTIDDFMQKMPYNAISRKTGWVFIEKLDVYQWRSRVAFLSLRCQRRRLRQGEWLVHRYCGAHS